MIRKLFHSIMCRLEKVTAPSLTGRAGGESAVLISLIFAACTSTIDDPQLSRPIAFTTYTSQPVTRADSALLAVNTIPWGKSIGVYAYYHDNCTWETDATKAVNFMCNQQATNNGLNQPFSYNPLKYWPNEETDKLSFIAYYPYSTGSTADVTNIGITPNWRLLPAGTFYDPDAGSKLPQFRFQVQENVKQQVDFMVSDLLPSLPNGTSAVSPSSADSRDDLTVTDRVHFIFRHALSKIEFRVIVDDDVRKDLAYFTLKGISLTNIYDEARLTMTYTSPVAPATEGTTALTWSDYDKNKKTDYSCKTTEAYLLLPQTLNEETDPKIARSAPTLTVTYDLAFKSEGTTYTYDASGNAVPTEEYVYTNRSTSVQLNTLKISGSSTVIDEWLPNHKYVYNLVIKPHRIEFTGQVVDDWGQEVPLSATMEE